MSVRADIQGLRGIAILFVVAFHSGLTLPGGFLGVDVFMVLSGFVIARMLLRELDETSTISFRDFYARRARRILPALAAVLFAVVAVGAIVLSPFGPQQLSIQTGAASTVFASNLFLYRHSGYFESEVWPNSLLHLWSLSVEEQVYLVLPAMLFGIARTVGRSRRRLAVGIGFVSALSFGAMLGLNRGWFDLGLEAPGRFAFYMMPTRFWEFGLGILAAIGWSRVASISRRSAEVVGAIGVLAMAFAGWTTDPGVPHPGIATLIPTLGAAAAIAAGAHRTTVTTLLSRRPIAWIGDHSYAWYLWHWPSIIFANVMWPRAPQAPVLAAVIALLPAVVSTRFIEMPIRRNASIRGARAAGLGLLCTVVPAIILAAGFHLAGSRLGLEEAAGWGDLPAGRQVGCNHFNRDGRASWPERSCTTSSERSRSTVLIVGDQHADSISSGAILAAESLRFGTALWSRSGCPMVATTPVHSPECKRWKSDVFALIDRLDPAAVIIANHSQDYVDDLHSEVVIAADTGRHPRTRTEALDRWAIGLDSVFDELARRDIPVVLVAAAPDHGPGFPRDRLSVLNPRPRSAVLARSGVETNRREVLGIEQRVVADHPGSAFVDPIPILCTEVCSPVRGTVWLYYDHAHLTASGGELLATTISAALDRATADR